mgnify:CR=1 FL=1
MNSTEKSVPFVDLHAQYLSIKAEIDEAIALVIRDSSFVRGPHVEQFEENFAKLIGTHRCVSCGNGTDALFIAMKALGVEKGDEVITTAHSWIATSETISLAGGKVAFADTDDSFCIDPDLIEAKITPRTKGIVVVHLFGQPADMKRIMAIAKRHGLWVIEDCAQAHLAEFQGQRVGTFGDMATFSFYPGKNLGAMGDAGAIVTNDDRLANWCELFARHGGKGTHEIEGINSRMDGLQAAILNVKMPHLAAWTNRRRQIAHKYNARLGGVPGLQLPDLRQDADHVYHLYVVRTQIRDALQGKLASVGIATQINYPCALPFLPAYRTLQHTEIEFPVAFRHQREILSLPIYPEMTDITIERVCRSIRQFFEATRAAA